MLGDKAGQEEDHVTGELENEGSIGPPEGEEKGTYATATQGRDGERAQYVGKDNILEIEVMSEGFDVGGKFYIKVNG